MHIRQFRGYMGAGSANFDQSAVKGGDGALESLFPAALADSPLKRMSIFRQHGLCFRNCSCSMRRLNLCARTSSSSGIISSNPGRSSIAANMLVKKVACCSSEGDQRISREKLLLQIIL